MKRLLPFKSSSRPEPDEGPRIVEIEDDQAGDVFETLASDTTRRVLTEVYNNPGTASEIAEAVDTSLQNTKYHLKKLQDNTLVEVADTWYSEQGNEMKVYVATNESIVMLASDEENRSSLREKLSRVLGMVTILGVSGIVIDSLLTPPPSTWEGIQSPSIPSWMPLADMGLYLSPGAVFFFGGMVAFAILSAWSYWN